MENLFWVVAGNAVIWLGICLYMIFLSNSNRKLNERIKQLELTCEK